MLTKGVGFGVCVCDCWTGGLADWLASYCLLLNNHPTTPPRVLQNPQDLQALGDVAGVVSRGLSADRISRLPQMTFKQLQQQRSGSGAVGGGGCGADADAEPHRCTICLVDLEDEGEGLILPYRH